MSRDVEVTSEDAGLVQNVSIGPYQFLADEPVEGSGCDAGPNPYELLLTARGACTRHDCPRICEPKRMAARGGSGPDDA